MHPAIKFLSNLIDINTANDNENELAQLIADQLTHHNISSKLVSYSKNRSSLIAEIGQGETVVGLTGHLDTVLPGDPAKWQYLPYKATIVDNRLYGRGAADMKSGIAALVFAFINLAKSADTLNGRVRLMLTVGEENGAQGAHQLTQLHYADDLTALIVAEPTDAHIIYAHNGSLNYTVTAEGKQVHSSMPAAGINAIDGLVAFYNEEKTLFDQAPVHSTLGPVVHSITVIASGHQVNSIPGEGFLRGNIRPIPNFDNDAVTLKLQTLLTNLNQQTNAQLTLTIDNSFWPVESDPNGSLVAAAKLAYQNNFKQEPTLGVIHGATDASEFVKGLHQFETIVMGPGPWEKAHMVDEYVETDQVITMIKTYDDLVTTYLQ